MKPKKTILSKSHTNPLDVEAIISSSAAGKLFGRLKAVK
jgi:hypothetical protein